MGLEGELFLSKGDFVNAVKSFEKGVDIEDENNYTEPPDWVQPLRHYLGAALLKSGKFKEAEAVYKRDLKWNQNNGWSLLGLHQSLELQGKVEESKNIYNKFKEAWKAADVEINASHL